MLALFLFMSLPAIITNRQHQRGYRARIPPPETAKETEASVQAHQERRALSEPRRASRPYNITPSPSFSPPPPSGPFTFTVSDPPVPHPGFTPADQSRSRHLAVGAPFFPPALYDFPMTTRAMDDPDLMDIDPPEAGPTSFVDGFAGSGISTTGHDTLIRVESTDHMNGTGPSQQAAQAAVVSQERTTARRMPAIVPRVCTVCCEVDGDVTLKKACPHCDARYCTDCLQEMFRAAIRDSTRMPPKCCSLLQLHIGLPHLTEDEGTEYRKAFEEWMTTNRTYCPVPNCSAFIPNRLKQRLSTNAFSCPYCKTTICEQCRQVAHWGPCDRSQAEYEEGLLKKFKMKQCPKCRTAVRRMYGCSHIECKCGAHWCYTCRMPIHECNGAHPEEFSEDDEEDDDDEADEEVHDETDEEVPLTLNPDEDDDDGDTGGIVEQDRIVRQTQVFPVNQPVVEPLVPVHQPSARDNSLPSTTSAVPEVDLDAGGHRRWEEEDLDFGEEPSDEFLHLDVWTCKHKLKRVRANDSFPMVSKNTVLECNSCFLKLKPWSYSTIRRRRKDAGTQTESSAPPPPRQQQQQQQGTRHGPFTVTQLPRQGGSLQPRVVTEDVFIRALNEAPYGCTVCNVLYCGKCKAAKGLS